MTYEIIEMENGETIYLESDARTDNSEGPVQASLRNSINKNNLKLTNEAAKVGRFLKELCEGILEELQEQHPPKIEFEVGLQFDQNVGCVIVGSTLSAQVNLKIIWENENGSQ